MYRRSKDYTITPEQKEEFIDNVKFMIEQIYWFYIIDNDYPYNMCRDKKVKTEHLTMFYYDIWYVLPEIREYINKWYSVQINSTEHQSIPEIQHLHFIKIIDD